MARIPPIFKMAASLVLKKPATTKYPYVKPELADNYRGQMQFDNKLCIGCGLCVRDCPAGAIEMVDFYGKKRPQFRIDKCLFCAQCVETCPKKAIKNSRIYELATTDKAALVMKSKHVIVCQA